MPARRRSAQTTKGRRMARTVDRHRSLRQLGGGPRRRLRRRLNARATCRCYMDPRSCAGSSVNAGADGRHTRHGRSSLKQQPGRRRRWLLRQGERQRRALASRRGSGRRQAHRRLSQPRQSGSAARSPMTPGWPARRPVAQVAMSRRLRSVGRVTCFALIAWPGGLGELEGAALPIGHVRGLSLASRPCRSAARSSRSLPTSSRATR
jgi:hypothetical protein